MIPDALAVALAIVKLWDEEHPDEEPMLTDQGRDQSGDIAAMRSALHAGRSWKPGV